MKRGIFLCLALFGLLFAGCGSDDDTWGDWSKESPISGPARVGAVNFKVNDTYYVGLGYGINSEAVNSFYASKDGQSWKLVTASFPGEGRMGAVAFVLGGKAYVGTGHRPNGLNGQGLKYYKDWYCFDPASNTWTEVTAEFPGTWRWHAIAFTLNVNGREIAYVGCGNGPEEGTNENTATTVNFNDFYSFDGTTWTSIGSQGSKRNGGSAFVINNVAYICLGYESGTSVLAADMWSFDGTNWKRLNKIVDATDDNFDNDYGTIQRAYAVAWVSKVDGQERGYIATGTNGSLLRNCWEYYPQEDWWDEVNPLPAQMSARLGAIAYTVGDYGYIGLGGTNWGNAAFEDCWRFVPGIEEEDKNNY